MKRCAKAIVDYDSSEEETTNQDLPAPKKRKLPALSANLIVPSPVDNPALHQGRVRTTPHVDGNWAAHVYVSINVNKSHALRKLLNTVIAGARESVPTLHSWIPGDEDSQRHFELHISLTRPIFIRAYQKEELRRVAKKLAQRSPFVVSFTTFAELQNDERTRTFLAMEIGAGHHELNELCRGMEPLLQSLRQQSYYSSPRFHASIAWALLDGAQTTKEDKAHSATNKNTRTPLTPSSNARDIVDPTKDHTPAEFSTIPGLPEDLVTRLNRLYATHLSSPKVGSFEVEDVTVRIGSEVVSWPFNGM